MSVAQCLASRNDHNEEASSRARRYQRCSRSGSEHCSTCRAISRADALASTRWSAIRSCSGARSACDARAISASASVAWRSQIRCIRATGMGRAIPARSSTARSVAESVESSPKIAASSFEVVGRPTTASERAVRCGESPSASRRAVRKGSS